MNSVSEHQLRELLVHYGRSLFMRGYSSGGSGNLSVKMPDGGYLVTPTNSCLGELDPATLSRLDANGVHLSGDKPQKRCPCIWRGIDIGHPAARSCTCILHG